MRFVQDNDAHWYLIPDDYLEDFYKWLEQTEDYYAEVDGADFDKYDEYRSNDPGYYSVTINE